MVGSLLIYFAYESQFSDPEILYARCSCVSVPWRPLYGTAHTALPVIATVSAIWKWFEEASVTKWLLAKCEPIAQWQLLAHSVAAILVVYIL